MKRLAIAAVCALIPVALIARRQAAPPQATFKSGIDLVQLDVTVLDKDRHPVKGLTAADFTILEDGKPRPVATIKEVRVPPVVKSEAQWIRDTPADVATNSRVEGRVVVIVIDDASFQPTESEGTAQIMDAFAIKKVREAAKTIINELGPDDLAAIVYTENNFGTEDFTKDHSRLLRAIDNASLAPSYLSNSSPTPDGANRAEGGIRGGCYCGLCSLETLGRIATSLGALKQERKTLLFISAGIPAQPNESEFIVPGEVPPSFAALTASCPTRRGIEMQNVFRATQQSNVAIHAFDPRGPMTGGFGSDSGRRTEFLRTVAETTGGRAIINSNTPERFVPAVLEESGSYYLLGFESGAPPADGRQHSLSVRVNRPDLEVLSRTSFYAPTDKEQKAAAKKTAPAGSPSAAIAGALPATDLPVSLSALPFRGADGKPEVAVVLGIIEPNDVRAADAPRTQTVDVVEGVFGPSGNSVLSRQQSLKIVINPSGSDAVYYETTARLAIPAGSHSLRVGARAGGGRVGSVYTAVDVPDFAKAPLSLSGVFIFATPAAKSAPKDGLKDVIPDTPTARRVFSRTDQVSALVKIYQGQSRAVAATTLTSRLTDSTGHSIEAVRRIDAPAFLRTHSVDHEMFLPTPTMPPGRYLLTMIADSGKAHAERTAVFTVR